MSNATYTVTQTREVKVHAESPEDAVAEAMRRWDDPRVPGMAYRVQVVEVKAKRADLT